MNHIAPEHQAEVDRIWHSLPEEWRNLPDDETTACGIPLSIVYPDGVDEDSLIGEGTEKSEFHHKREGR